MHGQKQARIVRLSNRNVSFGLISAHKFIVISSVWKTDSFCCAFGQCGTLDASNANPILAGNSFS